MTKPLPTQVTALLNDAKALRERDPKAAIAKLLELVALLKALTKDKAA